MNATSTQDASLRSDYSQTKRARYMRAYYLSHPEKLEQHNEADRRRRGKAAIKRVQNERDIRTKKTKPMFLRDVAHHMQRGRDAGRIAVWLGANVSEVTAAMEQVRKQLGGSK